MENRKVLSVVMPAYNMEAYLARSVQSVTAAGVMDAVEIIIVNDGSTDRTLEIANSIQAQYLNDIVVIDKANGNYGSAINAALETARGKYFKTLDCDDWYNTAHFIDYVQALSDSDEDLIINGYSYYIERTGKVISAFSYKEPGWGQAFDLATNVLSELRLDYQLNMPAMAFKTDVLRACGLRLLEKTFYTDTEYTYYPFQEARTIKLLPLDFYVYYLGREGQSMSPTNILRHFDSKKRVIRRMIDDYLSTPSKTLAHRNKRYMLRKNMPGFYQYILLSDNFRDEIDATDHLIREKAPELYEELGHYVQQVGVEYLRLFREGVSRTTINQKINRRKAFRASLIYRLYKRAERLLQCRR